MCGTFYVLRNIFRVLRCMAYIFKSNCKIEQLIGFQVRSLRGTFLRTPKHFPRRMVYVFKSNCKVEQLIGFQVRSLRGTCYVLQSFFFRVFRRMAHEFKSSYKVEQLIGFQVRSLCVALSTYSEAFSAYSDAWCMHSKAIVKLNN